MWLLLETHAVVLYGCHQDLWLLSTSLGSQGNENDTSAPFRERPMSLPGLLYLRPNYLAHYVLYPHPVPRLIVHARECANQRFQPYVLRLLAGQSRYVRLALLPDTYGGEAEGMTYGP
jgi:hypothetical protein